MARHFNEILLLINNRQCIIKVQNLPDMMVDAHKYGMLAMPSETFAAVILDLNPTVDE